MPAFDHRVALDPEEEVGVPAERLRDGELVLDVLLGEQRAAGRDLAEQRQLRRCRLARRLVGARLAPVADQVERARLRRIAPEQAGPFQVREVGVHGRGRGEADRLADLAHGGGIAMPVDVADEELPDLLLPCREHRASRWKVSNVCSL